MFSVLPRYNMPNGIGRILPCKWRDSTPNAISKKEPLYIYTYICIYRKQDIQDRDCHTTHFWNENNSMVQNDRSRALPSCNLQRKRVGGESVAPLSLVGKSKYLISLMVLCFRPKFLRSQKSIAQNKVFIRYE